MKCEFVKCNLFFLVFFIINLSVFHISFFLNVSLPKAQVLIFNCTFSRMLLYIHWTSNRVNTLPIFHYKYNASRYLNKVLKTNRKKVVGRLKKSNGLSRLPLNQDKDQIWQPYISIRSWSRNIEPVCSVRLLCCWPQWATNQNIATGCKHSPRGAAACTIQPNRFMIFFLFISLIYLLFCPAGRLGWELTSPVLPPWGNHPPPLLPPCWWRSPGGDAWLTLLIASVAHSHWIFFFLLFLFCLQKRSEDFFVSFLLLRYTRET